MTNFRTAKYDSSAESLGIDDPNKKIDGNLGLTAEEAAAVQAAIQNGFGGAADERISAGTADSTTYNILRGHLSNSIAGGDANIVAGGGNAANPNQILGSTAYRTISGGYDNLITDAIASTIAGGAHHRIATGATHGTVGGGSYNDIDAGDYSTIAGGTGNTVGASEATIGGGTANTVNAQGSTIAGGSTNTIASGVLRANIGGGINNQITAGNNGTIVGGNGNLMSGGVSVAGGETNTISGARSFVFGLSNTVSGQYTGAWGRANLVSADYASAAGYEASAATPGAHYIAGGKIAAAGDAQSFVTHLRLTTTNATPTDMQLAGNTTQLSMPSSGATLLQVQVIATEPATGVSRAWIYAFCYKRSSGATAGVGSVVTLFDQGDAGASAWVASLTSTAGIAAFRVRVTGEAAKTILWSARVTCSEVGF